MTTQTQMFTDGKASREQKAHYNLHVSLLIVKFGLSKLDASARAYYEGPEGFKALMDQLNGDKSK